MPDKFRLTLQLESDLAEKIDQFGEDNCPEYFNPETKRGRTAVYRRLLIDGLKANKKKKDSSQGDA